MRQNEEICIEQVLETLQSPMSVQYRCFNVIYTKLQFKSTDKRIYHHTQYKARQWLPKSCFLIVLARDSVKTDSSRNQSCSELCHFCLNCQQPRSCGQSKIQNMHLETRNSRLTQIEVLRNSKTQFNSECEVEDVEQAIYVIESTQGNYVIYSTIACRRPCFVTAITARRTQVLEDGLSLHAQPLPEDYIMQLISANGKHEDSYDYEFIKLTFEHLLLF
ncbi:Hypothetical_protein [Hexamita inflata]|uniref:Hypothetical_protein n=1 Tax=Hexamita inflata TaxID=28002 RepID=A0AA86Q7A0_9EUKA|nr:Hypothetical protein HINF_LOCUS34929 [Hexamita inflata]CAI9947285.1 Hypothetical protein HINF_LOCUS34930 [Hexamita inflata]